MSSSCDILMDKGGDVPVCKVKSCPLQVDIVLRSADGTRFGSHKKNLEMFNIGFPPVELVGKHSISDVVNLPEKTQIVELLLMFSHNEAHQEISSKGLDVVLALADAADKYGNHFATQACMVAMNHLARLSPGNAVRVIPYKVRNSDMQGIDDLVLRTMDMDMKQVRQHTQWCPQAFFILAEYREKWKACHMKYMDVIIQSDLVHSSRAPETGRIIFSIMLGTPFPTTVALDAAMEVAKKTMGDQASFGWPTDWIAKLRTVIRQFPVWNDLDSR